MRNEMPTVGIGGKEGKTEGGETLKFCLGRTFELVF
jgi:hypothetical protein